MIKPSYFILAAIAGLGLILTTYSSVCWLSDKQVIIISQNFCNMMNVRTESAPWVLKTSYVRLNPLRPVKEVVVGPRGDFQVSVDIDCNTREVIYFVNHRLRDELFIKNNLPIDNRNLRKWPKLLNAERAKEYAYSHAARLGLSKDVSLYRMNLGTTGIWNTFWKRTHNGYQYEEDSLSIDLIAIDGSLYSYGKYFVGKPCPTEVKVYEEKAKEVGRQKLSKILHDGKGTGHSLSYVLSSSHLRIIQPNAIFGFFTPFHRSSSRLGWVLTYTLHAAAEDHNLPDKVVIKVDAATGEVIGGSCTR